jgi:hypothetical protein
MLSGRKLLSAAPANAEESTTRIVDYYCSSLIGSRQPGSRLGNRIGNGDAAILVAGAVRHFNL